jgi:type III restriction enzyme
LSADEEHHLQALTKKKLSKEEINEKTSWEYTVRRVKNSNRDNILLEFSATANLENPEIKRKYEDKLIFDYPLSQFRKDGYSKDIDVIKLDMSPLDRALQAVIISQYRKKIAEKHKIHLKPVILMKSKRISESKLFESQFISMIRNLNGEKLNHIKSESVKKAFEYFRANGITIDNLVREIKEDFNENKCRAINSKEDIEENQILINKLEDKDNKIRVIFAVDMLNEGWDVLNLFDIVRLYDTRDSGITTTREAQLIGRGARYFPFSIKGDKGDEPDRFIRKFDQDVDNELKIIEELYYHSPNNIKYIQELKQELIKSGIIPKESKSIEVRVKEGFKHTKFYEKGKIFINEQIKNERRQIHSLEVLGIKTDTPYKYELKTGISQRYAIFEENENKTIEKGYKTYLLTDFGINVIQKAIHTKDFYSFNNLSIYLPNLLSIGEFISSEKYLGKVRVEVIGSKEQITKMSPQSKLETALTILSKIEKEIINNSTEYKGSKEFYPKLISEIFTDKVMNIHIDDSGDKELGRSMKETSNELLRLDLSQKDWYVYDDNYGTSEEKYLVRFINSAIEKLKEEYNEIYLMRNQKPFKIYKFSNGKPFEPDFVLFLKEKNKQKVLLYQLFIEAKGEQLKKKDEWKETFLLSLQKEFKLKLLHEEKEMRLFGMPFYNEDNKIPFIEKFEESLKVKL